MIGMMALRLRGEEKKKMVKYDFSMYSKKELEILENILKRYKVYYWAYNGYLCTYNIEGFSRALHYYLYEEE